MSNHTDNNAQKQKSILAASVRVAAAVVVLGIPLIAAAQISQPDWLGPTAATAEQAHRNGNFAQAAQLWQRISDHYAATDDRSEQTGALLRLAAALKGQGQWQRALQRLDTAGRLARDTGQTGQLAQIEKTLGQLYLQTGMIDQAREHLETATSLARSVDDSDLLAAVLNDLGSAAAARQEYPTARRSWQESARLAELAGNGSLLVKVSLNSVRLSQVNGDFAAAAKGLRRLEAPLEALQESQGKARALATAGSLWALQVEQTPGASIAAGKFLQAAATLANQLEDPATEAHAWGNLGQLYQQQDRFEDALALTRRAIFAAQQTRRAPSLFRWQWQSARLFTQLSDSDAAIGAYARAIATLRQAGIAVSDSDVQGQQKTGRVFLEFADLLLQRAPKLGESTLRQRDLVAAQDALEQLKSEELTDYFRDDCVASLQARTQRLAELEAGTAVVYPVILPDRLEMLLNAADGIHQITVPITAAALTGHVRDLRERLEAFDLDGYLPAAQQLHDWLIRPLQPLLDERAITTLVFVPDGPLRTIPMAALHDGTTFLIDRYAVATTPGLTLTDFRPSKRRGANALLNGLTEARQGFPALPNVDAELRAIESLFPATVLKNETYLLDSVRQELGENPYSIVHIASHGQFSSDVNESFLLTYDDKLTMDRLQQFVGLSRYRSQPVELLTLSACQTAAGDDRAALGLAGIAVKAGARSALASLWFIEDEATTALITAFYSELQDPALSKAQALQRAQLALIEQESRPEFKHPSFWAPFLLIGNWL